MSVRVMSWVWESSASKGNDRLVLLAIADKANDDGRDAFPSVAVLVRKTNLAERTVQRSLRSLVALGELEVDAFAGRNRVNVYRVVMDRVVSETPEGGVNLTPRQSDTPVNLTPGGVSN